jgi:hypothetical protein
MKRFAFPMVAALALLTHMPSFGAWLEPVPPNEQERRNVAADAFFEVPASKLGAAEAYLSKLTSVEDAQAAGHFGRPEFKCGAPSRIYLIRALYENGGTGVFELYWAGAVLVVSHSSLGAERAPERSALVACLSKPPSNVYSSISGAL